MSSDYSDTISAIRFSHRARNFAMRIRMGNDAALGAYLRTQLGWSLSLTEKERAAIIARAAGFIETYEEVEKAKKALSKATAKLRKTGASDDELLLLRRSVVDGENDPEYLQFSATIEASIKAREPFELVESDHKAKMEKMVQTLPIWTDWGADVRGFGPVSLAVIIGEAGDLVNYPNPGTLWKRMGIAVFNGIRQGGLPVNAKAEEWIQHGYSKVRRARSWVVASNLMKSGDYYREMYLRRKEYERQQTLSAGLIILPAAKIPAKKKELYRSEGHIHLRAQRYMEKKFLRDLWRAWRRSFGYALPEAPWPDEIREAA